jgi:hypothetical protein
MSASSPVQSAFDVESSMSTTTRGGGTDEDRILSY